MILGIEDQPDGLASGSAGGTHQVLDPVDGALDGCSHHAHDPALGSGRNTKTCHRRRRSVWYCSSSRSLRISTPQSGQHSASAAPNVRSGVCVGAM